MQAAVHEAALPEVVLEVLLGYPSGGHGELPRNEVSELLCHALYVLLYFVHCLNAVQMPFELSIFAKTFNDMTPKEKDELIAALIKVHVPGMLFSLSDALAAIDNRIGMGDAIEVVLELKERGFVEKYHRTFEDCRLSINSGLETFAQRGGFEIEDVKFQAELQKVFLEIKALRKEMHPALYEKIMKILEPLAPFAGIAIERLGL